MNKEADQIVGDSVRQYEPKRAQSESRNGGGRPQLFRQRSFYVPLLVLSVALIGSVKARAGTEVHFYGSDTNKANGQVLYYYQLLHYKRGLFLGICPTTKQLQWSYSVELAGNGPKYSFHDLTVKRDDRLSGNDQSAKSPLRPVAGNVEIQGNHVITIDIAIEQAGITNQFVGNGKYTLRE